MEKWYRNSWSNVVKILDSNVYAGLRSDEIEERRRIYGNNKIRKTGLNVFVFFLNLLIQMWLIVSLVDGGILLKEKQYAASAVILFTAFLGLLVQIISYARRYNGFKGIRKIDKHPVRVIRDNNVCSVKVSDLVVGDIVMLKKGDIVPADLRIIECESLKVKEGSITGENKSVEKHSTMIDEELSNPSSMRNILFKASSIVNGNCKAAVIATGMNSQAGEMLQGLSNVNISINLKKDILNHIKKIFNIHILMVLIFLVVFAAFNYNNVSKAVSDIEFMFFSATVNGIIIISMIFFVVIKAFISTQNKSILKISSLNKIISIDTMVMDKYGIISEKNILISKVYTDFQMYDIQCIKDNFTSNINRIIQGALFCNSSNSFNTEESNDYNFIADKQISDYIVKDGLLELENMSFRKTFLLPYDNDRRISTAVYKVEKNYRGYTKGTLDAVLNRCTHIMKDGFEVEISKQDIEKIRFEAIGAEREGKMVTAFSYRNFTYEPDLNANIESNMVFIGFISLENEIKESSVEFIERLKYFDINPIFITEDTKLAAFAWAKKLGIINYLSEVTTGVEIDNMTEDEIFRLCRNVKVYSKLSPSNKTRLIKALKENTYDIALTLRGSDDFNAASKADLNIAVIDKLTDIMKSISHLKIKNEFQENIIELINESYIIIRKINKIASFHLSAFAALLITSLYQLFYKTELFYNFNQVLWISFFNLAILSTLILIDEVKDREDSVELIRYSEDSGKILNILVPSYLSGVVIFFLSIGFDYIFSNYFYMTIDIYMIIGLLLIGFVNFYRLHGKKIFSLANLLYILVLLFNILIIILMNKNVLV